MVSPLFLLLGKLGNLKRGREVYIKSVCSISPSHLCFLKYTHSLVHKAEMCEMFLL